MHEAGPVVPVEILPAVNAWLVIGYDAALEVLRGPETFSKESRRWRDLNEGRIPPDSPVLPLFAWKPHAMRNDGEEHRRLRQPIVDSLARIDPAALRIQVQRRADTLIDRFAAAGEADLVRQFIGQLPVLVLSEIGGAPEDFAKQFLDLLFLVVEPEADHQDVQAQLVVCLDELVALKRRQPGADVISWMLEHPSDLTDEEIRHTVHLFLGLSGGLLRDFVVSVRGVLLADDRFAGALSGGNLPVDEAIDEVLWTDPPLGIAGMCFPLRDLDFHGARLRKGDLVLVGYAAANADPSVAAMSRGRNRGHLAWGAGPHTCPGHSQARMIAEAALERLLDRSRTWNWPCLWRSWSWPHTVPPDAGLASRAFSAAAAACRTGRGAGATSGGRDGAHAHQVVSAPDGSPSGASPSAAAPETGGSRGQGHMAGWWRTWRRTH